MCPHKGAARELCTPAMGLLLQAEPLWGTGPALGPWTRPCCPFGQWRWGTLGSNGARSVSPSGGIVPQPLAVVVQGGKALGTHTQSQERQDDTWPGKNNLMESSTQPYFLTFLMSSPSVEVLGPRLDIPALGCAHQDHAEPPTLGWDTQDGGHSLGRAVRAHPRGAAGCCGRALAPGAGMHNAKHEHAPRMRVLTKNMDKVLRVCRRSWKQRRQAEISTR